MFFKYLSERRGSVSIFLLIVLVPMMIVASIFVDVSRVQLASSVATAAGDLTLNTALTDYDATLKEMYGLFATSQNIDDLLVNLEGYYKKSIEAAGVGPAEAESYVDQIMSVLSTEAESQDILNMTLSEFTVTKPTAGSLSNPAMLKTQIVEFMKYRAPLSLGSGLLDALKGMKNLSKQTQVVEDKSDFYVERQTLLDNVEAAWSDIEKYQFEHATTLATTNFPCGSYLETQKNSLNDVHTKNLKEIIIPEVVQYFYYEDKLERISCNVYKTKGEDNVADTDDDVWYVGTSPYQVPVKETLDIDDIKSKLEDVQILTYYFDDYDGKVGYQNQTMNLFSGYQSKALDVNIYSLIQYCKDDEIRDQYNTDIQYFVSKLVDLKGYVVAFSDELSDYAIKNENDNLIIWEITDDNPKGSNSDLLSYINTNLSKHLCVNGTDKSHLDWFNHYMNLEGNVYDHVKTKLDGIRTDLELRLNDLRKHTYDFYNFIEGHITDLDNAIGHLDKVKKILNGEEGNYSSALNTWETSANGISGDSMGKNDLKEIEELKEIITVDDVTKLTTRLTNAKNTLVAIRDQIAAYKLGTTAFKDLGENPSLDIVKNIVAAYGAQIEVINPNDPSTGSYSTIAATIASDKVVMGNIDLSYSDQNSPDLTKSQDGLYTWMYNNYHDKDRFSGNADADSTSTTEDGDTKVGKQKENLKAEANKYNKDDTKKTEGNTSITDGAFNALPSQNIDDIRAAAKLPARNNDNSTPSSGSISTDSDTLMEKGGEDVSGILDGALALLDSAATTLRDDIFIATYVMGMFSYRTYEAEIVVSKGKDYTSAWYTKAADGTYTLSTDGANYIEETKSITNNYINPKSNFFYGSEVEYIIYGNKDAKTNLNNVRNTIFGIRLAFNTVYAFTDAEINASTTAAATALFGIPPLTALIPIVKIAMIFGLAIAESTYDVYSIMQGKEIPLMKNSSTWQMKSSNLVKTAIGEVATYVTNEVIDKGYEILDEYLTMTSEELNALIDGGTDKLSEVAKSITDNTIEKFYDYANESLTKVVELCNNENLKAMYDSSLMDNYLYLTSSDAKVQAVEDGLYAWLNEQGYSANDPIYEVKKAAIDYIISEGLIEQLFDKIKETTIEPTKVAAVMDGKNVTTTELFEIQLNKIRTDINLKVDNIANDVNSKLHSIKDGVEEKLREAAKNGAESLRTAIKEQIGNTFGTGSLSDTTSSTVTSIFSWAYSDYLNLFLIIALVADEEGVILRTGDLIELNMDQIKKQGGDTSGFDLAKSYTYLEIGAKIEVKPLLMTMPLVANTVENQLTGINWYEIEYSGIVGY